MGKTSLEGHIGDISTVQRNSWKWRVGNPGKKGKQKETGTPCAP
jgi:hypothetical protein